MRKPSKTLEGFFQVSEDIVRNVVKYIPEDEESGMRTVLKAADEFKAANMTPIFILDQNTMSIYVVAEETFGKKLH